MTNLIIFLNIILEEAKPLHNSIANGKKGNLKQVFQVMNTAH